MKLLLSRILVFDRDKKALKTLRSIQIIEHRPLQNMRYRPYAMHLTSASLQSHRASRHRNLVLPFVHPFI